MWIQADILCINLTPNVYSEHTPAIVYVINGAAQRTLQQVRMNGTEIVLQSAARCSNITRFLHVQGLKHGLLTVCVKDNQMKVLGKIWLILLMTSCVYKNYNKLQYQLNLARMIKNNSSLEYIMIVQCTVDHAHTDLFILLVLTH